MFSGIVECPATIAFANPIAMGRRLALVNPWPGEVPTVGQSIAVNGCCLTAASATDKTIEFDVIRETLAKTNLGNLEAGDKVNVERSLRVGDRIDGHFVQGHVDATSPLLSQTGNDQEWRLRLGIPAGFGRWLIPKGSVAIDGVSLTIAAVTPEWFEVALIPTTLRLTTLGSRPAGWRFNLEGDALAKTIVNWLELQKASLTV